MNLVQITPGAGGMYCGNCFRDNALVAALRRQGHDTVMVPLYLPMTLDETSSTAGTPTWSTTRTTVSTWTSVSSISSVTTIAAVTTTTALAGDERLGDEFVILQGPADEFDPIRLAAVL